MRPLTLATVITFVRILLIPVFMFLVTSSLPYGDTAAAIIFAIAALTDSLDGYAARMRKEVTRFGQLVDPLADKLLVAAALFTLVEMGRVSSWIAIVIVGREFAVSGLRIIAAVEGIVIPASSLAKVKTALQMVAIVALLLQWPFGPLLIWIATVVTVISAIDYFYHARGLFW
ncbi:MAG: CDP-diacylglycerol--glycerol-3-phosphate 3-phosphatidyltransferase [Firmicutes bacterium]|nr:CDP-diacylglycerol--glycerol-3-phosphate 3-phosphatidyltransferase [Bacillota bacterium]